VLVPDWTGTPDGCPMVRKRWGLAVSRAARGRETVPRFTGCARKWWALSGQPDKGSACPRYVCGVRELIRLSLRCT